MSRLRLACLIGWILFVASAAAAADVPYLTGRVVDDANVLSEAARTKLDAQLKAHEDATSNQVVVLTVPTIGDDSIEEYANQVFATWKLGQKGKDNGVLVVVVPNDHKMRIEVGYGLEPVLTDGACGEIIRTRMTPAFKRNDFDTGIEDGVAAIVARLQGQAEPPGRAPAVTVTRGRNNIGSDIPWPQRILIGAFIFSILGIFTIVGIGTPGMGWFLYVFLIPFWAMFPMVVIGPSANIALLGVYLIGYPIAKLMLRNKPWYVRAARDLKTKGSTSIGGFTVFSGGGGGGGFSSGGGFSGGGGSSGGGGASGSW